MGISIFEYDEELLKKDQFEYGMERGREQDIQFTLISLVKKGLITISDAAKESDLSPEEFQQLLNQ